MNKVILIGTLTRDPEINTTSTGLSVTKFTLAVTRRHANSEGERETDFINVVAWRTLAENCHKFLKKGSKAGVVGTLQIRSYEAQDGTKRYSTEVIAEEVEFVSPKGSVGEKEKTEKENVAQLEPIEDDGLPF